MIPVYISSVFFFFKKHKHMCISIQSFLKKSYCQFINFQANKNVPTGLSIAFTHSSPCSNPDPDSATQNNLISSFFVLKWQNTHTHTHTMALFLKFYLQHDVEIIPCQFVLIFLFFIVMEYSTVYLLHWPLMNGFQIVLYTLSDTSLVIPLLGAFLNHFVSVVSLVQSIELSFFYE